MHARCSSTSLHAFALPALGLAWSFYARGRAPWWISTVVGAVSISRRLHLSHFQLVLPHPRLPHAALGRDSFLGSQNDRKIDQSPGLHIVGGRARDCERAPPRPGGVAGTCSARELAAKGRIIYSSYLSCWPLEPFECLSSRQRRVVSI